MVVDNSPEARLKRLQENNMWTWTTASNLTKQVVSSTPTSVNWGVTPITTPTPATPTPLPTTPTPTTGVVPKNDLQSFRDATAGQDKEFRQTYREGLTPKTDTPTETTPTESKGAVGLEWAMLGAYNQLSDQEKKTYDSLALSGLKSQTDYLQKVKEQKEFMWSQEATRVKMSDNTMKMEEIASQERLAKSQKSLADLKQNVGYLGMWGTPWKSQAKLDAVTRQVSDAENTYRNIVEVERLMSENRTLGQQSNAEQYSRQLEILQDDLDGKVNKVLQGALNEFSAKEMEWKLDTIEEIEAFQQQIYSQMDNDISSLTDINLEARKFLIERYDALAKDQKEQMLAKQKADAELEKNKNTLNKDMSNALGYYVNNNWEPLVDETTWMRIVVPPETTTNYDPNTWQMILMTKNRDGSIGVQLKQVWAWKVEAPKTIQVDNPDGTKSTMQWNGSQWSPIQAQTAGGATPSGTLSTATVNGKNIQLDAVASQSLNNVASLLWGNVILGEWHRTRERQSQLYEAYQNGTGWLAAPPWQSKHESGMAIDIYSGKDRNGKLLALTPEQVKIMNANGWVQNAWADDMGHFEYVGTSGIVTQPTWWLAEDINVKVANIGNIAFGRTMSDTEGKRVESIIKQNPNASVNDIALAVRGLNIAKEEDKPLALEYVNIFDKMSDSVKPKTGLEMTISKYINAGDYKWLNDFVTKNVDRQVKADSDSPILTPEYNVGKQRTDKLVGLIEKNKDKIGIVSGNVSDFLQKFEWDKDYQQIKTILQMSQADMRKYFAGSAVTETEMKALADFIWWSTKMSPDNLVTMLQTLDEDRTNTYNAQREWFQIPNVNAVQAKKKLGWFSLSDILNNLD